MVRIPPVLMEEGRLERVRSILETCEELGVDVEVHSRDYLMRVVPDVTEDHPELMQTLREWKWCIVAYERFMRECGCERAT